MTIFKTIAKLKVYILRAGTWITIINFILIVSTFIKVWNIQISFWVLSPLIIIVSIIVGYIDVEVLKLFKYENDIMNLHNRIEDIKKDLEMIKKKLVIE
jgi:hypothetical protein